jgi:hypothetical protein
MKFLRLAFTVALVLPMLQACSNSTAPAPAASAAATATATAPDAPAPAPAAATPVSSDPHQACNLVTAAEMSTIVGSPMTATPHDDSSLPSVSNCAYAPASGRGSSVDFTVMYGDGESTLKMDREMKNHDTEADKRFAGVGDDAVVVSPAVQIRQGKDLLVLVLFGFDDEPATARKIVDTAKARM